MINLLIIIAREKLILYLLYVVVLVLAIVIIILIVQLIKKVTKNVPEEIDALLYNNEQSCLKEEVMADIIKSETEHYDDNYGPTEEFFYEEKQRKYIRYRKSFLARLIQSSDFVKNYYISVRNALLSYKKVKSRVSWNFDSINFGRKKLVKIKAHKKSLYFYCSLTFADLEGKKYYAKDVSDKKKYIDTSLLLKIKSERGLKNALRFVAILAKKYKLKLTDMPQQQSKAEEYSYDTTENLIKRGLIKINNENINNGFGAMEMLSSENK